MAQRNHHHQPVVTSGESDHEEDSIFASHIRGEDSDVETTAVRTGSSSTTSRKRSLETVDETLQQEKWERPELLHPDLLYDASADDQDEAFVNQHYRRHSQSAQQLPQDRRPRTAINKHATSKNDTESSATRKMGNSSQPAGSKPSKPPNSDAVLSCPCCFATVCMDCQQHERFPNQYRAMFVMNIAVRWEDRLVYSSKERKLVEYNEAAPSNQTTLDGKPIYYRVRCASCQTHVASLDMTEEVYHFYGCLASS